MDRVLELTPEAIEKVLLVREREQDPERHALWIEVGGGFPGTLSYDLWLAPAVGLPEDAVVEDHGPFLVVLPGGGAELLRGAVLDREGDLATGGLVLREPAPTSPQIELPDGGQLPDDLAARVAWVLETHINPAIAGHGGKAELVAVEQGAVHLRMMGGCQGCGMAAVTLREGIERTLRSVAPEITQVVDVTDHATGMNPYYEPATG